MIRATAAVLFTTIGTLALTLPRGGAPPGPPHAMVVHEWGTVTTHHDANGVAEGGLNILTTFDPLPEFVHRFQAPPARDGRRVIPLIKATAGDTRPDVTMRLETPVLYFHPAPGDSIAPFDVRVSFRGGVLNEFYPIASASVNGWNGEHLSDSVTSTLEWKGVALHDHVALPITTARVWLAPRAVQSRPLTIAGENEQYIFYRGMANLPAVLRTDFAGNELRVRSAHADGWFTSPTAPLGHVWLLDVRPNGTAAFRETDSLTLARGDTARELVRFRGFTERDYSRTTLDGLRASMHRALVGRGLYDDEATAMLTTWQRSYFLQPGLRVFYIAPPAWVTYHLPLEISAPTVLTRVIVGRIDLQVNGWP